MCSHHRVKPTIDSVEMWREMWCTVVRQVTLVSCQNMKELSKITTDSWMILIGEKIRVLRQQQGLTIKQLALALGFPSHSYISEIENGKKIPSIELIIKLADLFHVSVDLLVRDEINLDEQPWALPRRQFPKPGLFQNHQIIEVAVEKAAQLLDGLVIDPRHLLVSNTIQGVRAKIDKLSQTPEGQVSECLVVLSFPRSH
jgi:transcriptional regulator with XRE-family HTH domain